MIDCIDFLFKLVVSLNYLNDMFWHRVSKALIYRQVWSIMVKIVKSEGLLMSFLPVTQGSYEWFSCFYHTCLERMYFNSSLSLSNFLKEMVAILGVSHYVASGSFYLHSLRCGLFTLQGYLDRGCKLEGGFPLYTPTPIFKYSGI